MYGNGNGGGGGLTAAAASAAPFYPCGGGQGGVQFSQPQPFYHHFSAYDNPHHYSPATISLQQGSYYGAYTNIYTKSQKTKKEMHCYKVIKSVLLCHRCNRLSPSATSHSLPLIAIKAITIVVIIESRVIYGLLDTLWLSLNTFVSL